MPDRSPRLLPPGVDARLLLMVWSVPVLLGVPYTLLTNQATTPGAAVWRGLVVATVTWQVWTPISLVVIRLADRFPLERPWRPGRVAMHLGCAVLACGLQALATTGAVMLLFPETPSAGDVWVWWFLILAPAGVIVYFAVVGFRSAQRAVQLANERELEARELAARLTESQLLALRAQVQPHFLFNTLNGVVALVRDGENGRAAEAITSLAAMLRATLEGHASHETSLREELEFVNAYLRIESMRLGERLQVRLDVAPGLMDAVVPALVLQPLVENAIKHGAARVRGPVTLEVVVQREPQHLRLIVRDDGAGLREGPGEGPGVGLANLRARLEHLYRREAWLELRANPGGRGTTAEVRVPWRPAA